MGTPRRGRSGNPPRAEASAQNNEAARLSAIALLARRDLTSGELRKKLDSQGYDAAVIAAVVAELAAERFLDDARSAENYVMYHSGRGHGPLRIAADLRTLGVPDPLIETALASVPDWRALARQARIRKFGAELPEELSERTRQARFLQYRGFSSDDIRAVTGADFDADS